MRRASQLALLSTGIRMIVSRKIRWVWHVGYGRIGKLIGFRWENIKKEATRKT
jgi:hypothetical protein